MDVLMPQLGETVTEGKISAWFKRVGDAVAPGDNLFEIETDKVSMEVPAITAGVLEEIRVPVGETAAVGNVVAVIGTKAAASPSSPLPAQRGEVGPAPAKAGGEGPKLGITQAAAPHPEPSPREERGEGVRARGGANSVARGNGAARPVALDPFFEVRTPERNFGPARLPSGAVVTPLARRLAGEAGVDLKRIKGSGPHGRITARDVEDAVRSKPSAPAAAAPAMLARGRTADQIKALYPNTPFEEVALDNMRRTIAARLLEAKQTIPHFYLSIDVRLDRLLRLRQKLNAATKDTPAYRLSVNDFVIKGLALALQRVPAANAVWAEDRILRFKHSDVGVAVAVEGGLLTPVIRAADTKSLSTISAEMQDLAARARTCRLRPEEYQGGATTVSNLGMHGVREFSGIINPPQATLLAVGAAQRRPVETKKGRVKFATQMTVTLSCDHRVVDGVLGAELLAAFKDILEHPLAALV